MVRADSVSTANKVALGDVFTSESDINLTYAMSDSVTPEDFDAALSDARAEGNVSRASVVRKVKERTHAELVGIVVSW